MANGRLYQKFFISIDRGKCNKILIPNIKKGVSYNGFFTTCTDRFSVRKYSDKSIEQEK